MVFCYGRLRQPRNQSLGISWRGLLPEVRFRLGRPGTRESNVRKAGARRGFRATAQSAKGLPRGVNPKDFNIGLGPAPEHDMSPHPLTPKNPGHRGPTAGSWQPRAGLWPDGPSETTASVHCTLPRPPERVGTCPYFPWPQRLFELTFTSSRRPGQALSDDVA